MTLVDPLEPYTGVTRAVLTLLKYYPSGVTPTELAENGTFSRRRASEVLVEQERRGVVTKDRSGRYFLAGTAGNVVTTIDGPPIGWESPKLTLDGDTGLAYSGQTDKADPDEHELMGIWKLDPQVWTIDGPLGVSAWQGFDGEWKYAYKARVVRRTAGTPQADIDALVTRARRKVKSADSGLTGSTFCVFLSDWQLGKSEGGGTPATIERILGKLDLAVARIKELRKLGRAIGTIAILGLGDIVEGCDGHYAMQTFSVDLDRRAQERLARELIFSHLQALVPLAERIIVGCVPGNHGENRRKGKAFTTFADNADVAVFEAVAFVCEQSEQYRHLEFIIPNDELVLTIDLGLKVAILHGHQLTRGTNPSAKAEEWLKGMALGQKPAGYADLVVSGHYHHFAASHLGPRTWLQVPALDGGSAWWDNVSGKSSPTGLLTLLVGSDGWSDLEIL